MYISEPVIAPLEAKAELLVVKTKQVHPGGLQVVYVNLVTCNRESQLVGFSVGIASPGTTSGNHHAVGIWKMITSEDLAL